MPKLDFHTHDGLHMLCNGDEGSKALIRRTDLYDLVQDAADKDCRYCRGTGIAKDNDTVCGCTLDEDE